MYNFKKIIAITLVIILPGLSGCAAVLIGGAVATGVAVTEDRRTIGTITEDQGIELKASSRIGDRIKNAHISITSYNRSILLTGEVPTVSDKAEAERIARATENVRGVINYLQIAENSSVRSRSNDLYISSKVKGRFVDNKIFSPLHVKVVTENSTVYLLGIVNRKEANEATQIASTTSGVSKVIRVFEYLD